MATTLPPIPELTIEDLTVNMAGDGVFDVLMRNVSEHINAEMKKTRLTGNEFSALYLGGLQQVLNTSLEFLLRKRKETYEIQILELQARVAEAELEKIQAEIVILEKQGLKIPAEIALLEQQTLTEVEQTKVVKAQECKLRAEYDVLVASKIKTDGETALLAQKVETERAQTNGANVTPDSVIGKQIALYTAQTKGFKMDAITKAAKEMIATWNVRRTTDSGTQANGTNKLDDPTIGAVVQEMITQSQNF